MTDGGFRYILRYLIDPTHAVEERIDELTQLCRRGQVEEVMLLLCAEELSAGHPDREDVGLWIALAREVRDRLASEGVALSVNPWSTIYHNQRGRRLRPGQDFRLMVGENGVTSSVSVCPLCEKWQEYLIGVFARFAVEIEPVALWLEDDWRLHNHDRALGWGGCFCPVHLEMFSHRVGQKVTRPEWVAAMIAPGSAHPWRAEWLALSRETLSIPLSRLAQTLQTVAPEIPLGIMSSDPDQHSFEGRSWAEWQSLVGGRSGGFLCRPHLPPYTQSPPMATSPSVTRHTLALIEGSRTVYPELENSPRCGPYSKSRAYSRWQMLHSALYGSDGITINHFDMLGNGESLDPEFAAGLAETKPMLDSLKALSLDDRRAEGIHVLFDLNVGEHFQMPVGSQSLRDAAPESVVWGRVFSVLGIAHRFTFRVPSVDEVVAISGQTLRGFSDTSVVELLRGRLLLDATAAAILLERGYGEEIGIAEGKWKSLQESAYSYESLIEEDASVYGVAHPRLSAQRCADALFEIEPFPSAQCLSTIHDARHRRLWPGAIEFENHFGGRVVTLSYPVHSGAQFFMAFFNGFRRRFLQDILFSLGADAKLAAVENHPMHVYRSPLKNGSLLAALNVSDDPANEVLWRLPEREKFSNDWLHLQPDGRWMPIRSADNARGRHRFRVSVAPLDAAIFRPAMSSSL